MKIPALMIFTAIVLQVSFGKKLRLLTGFNGGMVPGVLSPGYMVGGAQPPMINMGGGFLQPQYPQMLPGVPLPPMIPSQPYGIPYAPNGLPQSPYMVPFNPNPSLPLQQPLPGQMVSPTNGGSPNYPGAPQPNFPRAPLEANPAQQQATGGPGWDGVQMEQQAMTPAPRTRIYKRFAPRMTHGGSLSTKNEVPTQIMPTPTEDWGSLKQRLNIRKGPSTW